MNWTESKPRNNECPVCGTMATAYRRVFAEGSKPWRKITDDPADRMTRCYHCNVVFWQDAEE